MGADAAEPDDADPDAADHEAYFQALNDGCGCTEIWEYLSERRREGRSVADRE